MRLRLLYAALLAVSACVLVPAAHANRDIVQFGSDIRVGQDQAIHDAVCFLCNVEVRGAVDGDIVVFFGNVHIAGHANHDIVSFFGSTRVEDDATVSHDLVSLFGNVHLGENVSVGHDMVALFGGAHIAPSATVGGDRVIQPGWIFWTPLLIIGLVVVLVVREIRSNRRRAYLRSFQYPPPR